MHYLHSAWTNGNSKVNGKIGYTQKFRVHFGGPIIHVHSAFTTLLKWLLPWHLYPRLFCRLAGGPDTPGAARRKVRLISSETYRAAPTRSPIKTKYIWMNLPVPHCREIWGRRIMAETKTDGKKCLGHDKGSRWRQDMIRQRAYLQEIGWSPGGETHHQWPSDLNDFQPSTVICNTSNVAAPSAAHAVVQHLGPEPDLSFWDLEPEATKHRFLLKKNKVTKHGKKTSWKPDSHISHVTRSSL